MPKCDTIDAIRRLNPTATPEFLVEFSNDELAQYLDRLETASRRQSLEALIETPAHPCAATVGGA